MTSSGRELLNMLEENEFAAENIFATDTDCPLGTQISYGEDVDMDVYNLHDFDFGSVEIAVFCVSEELTKHYVPRALAKGAMVIDCSGAYAMESDVPLIISGLNEEKMADAKRNIIALPSSQVTQILVPLQKIYAPYKVKRLVVNTYTAVSACGKEAMVC